MRMENGRCLKGKWVSKIFLSIFKGRKKWKMDGFFVDKRCLKSWSLLDFLIIFGDLFFIIYVVYISERHNLVTGQPLRRCYKSKESKGVRVP